MKKIFLVALLVSSISAFANIDPVNEKVLNAFSKTFQEAKEVSWSESPETYEVKFKQNEIRSRVYYDKEGNILKAYRYYFEQNLPLLVLSKVKAKYTDKKIFGVVEVSSDEGTFYYITLEGEKDWKEIKADSYGSMTVERKFKKA